MSTLGRMSTDKFAKIKGGETSFGMFFPTGYVVVTFEKLQEAQQAQAVLLTAGFVEDDVLLFTGPEVIQHDHELKKNANLLTKLEALLSNMGDESNYVDQYLELAHKNHTFLLVYAPDDKDSKHVAALIKPFHPHRARKYDAMKVIDLYPSSSGL